MTWLDDLVSHAQDNLGPRELEQLHIRGVTDEQVAQFQIGYLDARVELPPLEYPSTFLTWWYDHAWQLDDSFVFPLTTPLGQVVGLQFRHVDRSRPGYLDFFHREDEVGLFGLGQAMAGVWDTGVIWLVEGVFDLFPVQRHIPHVVATLRAGVSPTFWRVLRRIAAGVHVAYDADPTGRAVSRSIAASKSDLFKVKVVDWPSVPLRGKMTKDPNELWEAWGDLKLGVFLRQQL